MIADNPTAREYDRLQKSVDWSRDDNLDEQEVVINKLEALLRTANVYEVIFDFQATDNVTGEPIVQNVKDRYRAITRFGMRLAARRIHDTQH